MNLTGGIVLFAVIWFLVFFIVLPIRFQSQADTGHVVPGTPASAPSEAHIRKKAIITTAVAVVLWSIAATIILSGWVTIRDLDVFDRIGSGSATR